MLMAKTTKLLLKLFLQSKINWGGAPSGCNGICKGQPNIGFWSCLVYNWQAHACMQRLCPKNVLHSSSHSLFRYMFTIQFAWNLDWTFLYQYNYIGEKFFCKWIDAAANRPTIVITSILLYTMEPPFKEHVNLRICPL